MSLPLVILIMASSSSAYWCFTWRRKLSDLTPLLYDALQAPPLSSTKWNDEDPSFHQYQVVGILTDDTAEKRERWTSDAHDFPSVESRVLFP